MKSQYYCDTCYDTAEYRVTSQDDDGFEDRVYACGECVDQYDEADGYTIDGLDF